MSTIIGTRYVVLSTGTCRKLVDSKAGRQEQSGGVDVNLAAADKYCEKMQSTSNLGKVAYACRDTINSCMQFSV